MYNKNWEMKELQRSIFKLGRHKKTLKVSIINNRHWDWDAFERSMDKLDRRIDKLESAMELLDAET